ncbi:Hypothetical protein, predicted transmembrane protein [Mycoplasmopsis agalactiae 14628]|uniref:Uncharacterized protein n=1 Tax=Mycoplasmopsis agalactiae 14628 TaxID=1110504 RepID=I5D690_MYCAA|nr:hypothetical protein [Mycoplasmopsis agalactiae]EIN15199.1 Hypothetical protein, predicted transmembrane protein [Mycoplasmopsis agalactiae 14628]
MSNINNEREAKYLEKEKKLIKPYRVIITSGITILLLLLVVFIVFFPFKGGSWFSIIIDEFKTGKWSSKTIGELFVQFSVWAFLIWKLITRINETILYIKKKKLFDIDLETRKELNALVGRKVRKWTREQKNKYVDYVLGLIIEVFSQDNNALDAFTVSQIKETLENDDLERKEKIIKVTELIEKTGKKIDTKEKISTLKQI